MREGYNDNSASAPSPGFAASVAAVAKNLLGLTLSRIELAALELGEARNVLLRLLLVGALAIVAIGFALAGWSALIIVLAWETWGWKILLLLALAFTALAALLLWRARGMVAGGSLSLPATLSELRADRDALL
ncbi:Uncharacterized membrane protein YqjE [Noviherbaspirillum humi]|uniref:Uncharacterized membrane protein YqjE n=1 Tax=Noviherbaspirillum humi TaxID=1688639 RepID=A0A239BWW4_9BURK|nr:phage holin family protein [Noviherbaspirillum humi]SNS12129.1 Uncharacterized membrane protein YqjE [Noviherbaspirillum humi]